MRGAHGPVPPPAARSRSRQVAAAVRRGVHWTGRRILAELARRAKTGKSLTPARVATTLYAAARRLFGSWRKALVRAGLAPTDHLVSGRWDRERVLGEVWCLHGEGRPLSATKVKYYARSLWHAAARNVGRWGAALRAAGLDPSRHREPNRWSLERGHAWICDRLCQGRPITAGHVPLGPINCVAREARTGWGALWSPPEGRIAGRGPGRGGRLRAFSKRSATASGARCP